MVEKILEKLRSRRVRVALLVIAGLLMLFIGWLVWNHFHSSSQQTVTSVANQSKEPEQVKAEDPNIRIIATGDWIAHDAINAQAKTDSGYDYSSMLAPFKDTFGRYDIKFCNQATLAAGEKFGITGYPVFNAPLEWIRDMKGLGCNVINTGTNHTNDKGQEAINAQLDEWDKQDVMAVAGANRSTAEQNKVRYFEVKGVKFAFLSYSTYSNTPNPNSYSLNRFAEPLVTTQMTEARANADVVIVSMRWGTEYSETINSEQNNDAQKLANLGADIILGHGTHTLQPVKRLSGLNGREAIAWYSLGNFLNAQLETTGLTGCTATFTIDSNTKKVTDSTCLPFYQHYEWTAQQKAAQDLLARHDFRIMPLYNAASDMAKSQIGTTVEEQMNRITGIVNTYTKIPVQNGDDL